MGNRDTDSMDVIEYNRNYIGGFAGSSCDGFTSGAFCAGALPYLWQKKEDLYAKGRVSWLLHLLHLTFSYEEGKLQYQIRILGIPLIREKKEKKGKEAPEPEKEEENKPAEVVALERKPEEPEKIEEPKKTEELGKPEEVKKSEEPEKTGKPGKTEETKQEKTQKKGKPKPEKKEKPKKDIDIKKIVEEIKVFWQENKPAVQKIFRKIRELLKALLPKKLEGTIWFGTGDPCTTGELTGVLAVLYGFYGERLHIYPDFNRAVFETELLVAGKIRLFTFLRICITVVLDKEIGRLIKNIKSFGSEHK